jgi:putative peptidoglycan lipid II flippase
LKYFTLSLFAQSVIPLLTRSFYATHNTKTPFYIAIFSEIINIAAVFLLIGKFEIRGLAMAFSLTSLLQMFLLFVALRSRFDDLGDKKIIRSIGQIAVAAIFSGIGVQISKYLVASLVNMETFLGVFFQLAISGTIGILVFLAICHFLQLEEYLSFKKSLTKRIFKDKRSITENTGEVSGV